MLHKVDVHNTAHLREVVTLGNAIETAQRRNCCRRRAAVAVSCPSSRSNRSLAKLAYQDYVANRTKLVDTPLNECDYAT